MRIISLFIAFIFAGNLHAGFPQGAKERMYKDTLIFSTIDRSIGASDVDPSGTATAGEPGDVIFHSSGMYVKQDSGSNTNWDLVQTGEAEPIALQDAYDNSTDGEITVDGTLGSFKVLDASTPIEAPILEVLSNDKLTSYFQVDDSGATVGGNLAVSGTATVSGGANVVHENNFKNYVSTRRNLLENASFEEGTNGTCTSVLCSTTTRPSQSTPLDANALVILQSSGTTWDWNWNIANTEFNDTSMIMGCSFYTDYNDVSISYEVDATEFHTQSLVAGKWSHVYIPTIGGATDYDFKMDGTDFHGGEVAYVDNCYLGVPPPGYFQQIQYENYIEIDVTGSGDFTGGKIAVGRIGSLVTVTVIDAITHSSATTAISDPGLVPDWASPKDRNAPNTVYSNASIIYNSFIEPDGSLNLQYNDYSGSSIANTSFPLGSISYTAADAKESTTATSQKKDDIIVSGQGSSGAAITAFTEAIDFTEVTDNTSSWTQKGSNGTDTFTAPEPGTYLYIGKVRATADTATWTIYSYIDGTQSKASGRTKSDLEVDFQGALYLDKGQELQFRSGDDFTQSNIANLHHIHIQKISNRDLSGMFQASQIKGLKKKCQTKTLSADVTSTGVVSDLTFNNLVIGETYELTGGYTPRENDSVGSSVDRFIYAAVSGLGSDKSYRYRNRNSIATWEFQALAGFPEEATGTSITFEVTSIVNAKLDSGFTQFNLCHIPEHTIEETTEF